MSDLPRDVMMFNELANEIDADVEEIDPDTLPDAQRDQALTCWALLEEANRTLAGARSALAKKLAGVMPDKHHTIEHVGTFERHRKADRKQWDREELLRFVLDTTIFDPTTGEATDPTPLDKVLHVWNLGAPRVTALRERGLDPDEFCSVEYGGWTLQLVANNAPAKSEEEAA